MKDQTMPMREVDKRKGQNFKNSMARKPK